MWKVIAALMTALLVAWGAPASAQMGGQPGGMMGPGAGGGGTRAGFFAHEGPLITLMLSHAQELALSSDQTQKLQELRTSFDKEAVQRTADIRAAEIDLNSLLEKDQWDLPAIEAKARQIATLQGDLRIARLKTLAAGRALLTPEQLQKLKAIGHWRPPAGAPGRRGPGQPYGPGGQGPMGPGPGGPPPPPQ